jgi:hypothetical protein
VVIRFTLFFRSCVDLSDDIEAIGYLLIQGSSGFAAQGDMTNRLQFLWPLWHFGVPPEHVRVFLAPHSSSLGYPSPHAGFPRLFAPGAEACSINESRDSELKNAVRDAITEFFDLESVNRIVFVYLNHADDGFGRGSERFGIQDFTDWATTSLFIRKPLLFVLGARDSTTLAEQIWDNLSKWYRSVVKDVERFVRFLTSGPGTCMSSANVHHP